MAFTEDLSAFFDLDGFAVRATWGAHTAAVIYSEPTEDGLMGDTASEYPTAELAASDLSGIDEGAELVIDGKGTFRVREKPRLIADGAIKRLVLRRV